jgi:hypothetical protein
MCLHGDKEIVECYICDEKGCCVCYDLVKCYNCHNNPNSYYCKNCIRNCDRCSLADADNCCCFCSNKCEICGIVICNYQCDVIKIMNIDNVVLLGTSYPSEICDECILNTIKDKRWFLKRFLLEKIPLIPELTSIVIKYLGY